MTRNANLDRHSAERIPALPDAGEDRSGEAVAVIEYTHHDDIARVDRATIVEYLSADGVVILRYPEFTARDFETLAARIGFESFDYQSSGRVFSRSKIAGHEMLYAATHSDRQPALALHQEIAYATEPPDSLWFFCKTPPPKDGETLLCDGHRLLEAMSPATRRLFLTRGLQYSLHHTYEHWSRMYQSDDIDVVRGMVEEQGMKLQHHSDNSITVVMAAKAVQRSRFSGSEAFVNAVLVALESEREARDYPGRGTVRLGDGEPIPPEAISECEELAVALSYAHVWQRGDIVLLDNTRYMHGRNRVTAPGREILTIIGDLTRNRAHGLEVGE